MFCAFITCVQFIIKTNKTLCFYEWPKHFGGQYVIKLHSRNRSALLVFLMNRIQTFRSSVFWDVKQGSLVVSYRRFGTCYQYRHQGSCSPFFLDVPTDEAEHLVTVTMICTNSCMYSHT